VLFLEAQRFLERVGIGLVQLEARVGVANPGAAVGDAQLPLARHDLLDAHGDFHVSYQLPATSFQLPAKHSDPNRAAVIGKLSAGSWQLVAGSWKLEATLHIS